MPNQNKGTPSWVERGLNMIESASDVLLIDQSSTNSGLDCDRSSLHGSDEGRSFLRGQNVPLEPEIKAQRENKRVKALELQSAILSQLEEREKQRQQERERRLHEERMEELRIQKQQEEDKLRVEAEKRRSIEKQLLEQRKLETLRKALEDAELKARQEKEKRLNYHRKMGNLNNLDENLNNSKDKEIEIQPAVELPSLTSSCSPVKTHRTYNVQSPTSQKKENNSQQTSTFNSPRSVTASNLNLFIHNVPPLSLPEKQFNIVPIGVTNAADIVNCQTNSIQLAVLVPQNKNICSVSLNSINHIGDMSEIEKILTPRKYRTLRTRDAYTQTDCYNICSSSYNKLDQDVETSIDKVYPKIDENAPQEFHRTSTKKERRLRSEERYKKDIENRPKWGANKPIAQYKKQSEKDPFYTQKRKVRQKHRPQVRQYASQSSEDSRSPSPPTRSDNNLPINLKQRNSMSQSHWKNKRALQDFSATSTYKVANNGVPEFTSLSQITGNEKNDEKKSPKVNALKRITLSQKFINDKYGSRKLWVDDVNERNAKYSLSDLDNPKRDSDKSFIRCSVKDKLDQSDI